MKLKDMKPGSVVESGTMEKIDRLSEASFRLWSVVSNRLMRNFGLLGGVLRVVLVKPYDDGNGHRVGAIEASGMRPYCATCVPGMRGR